MSAGSDDENLDCSNISDELAKLDENSNGTSNTNDNNSSLGDTWIEELECALLADCDPITLKKISEGRQIPATLRPDYWRALLSLNDAVKVKLTGEFNLSNQDELRRDCINLVEDISTNSAKEPLSDAEKLQLRSNFESTLTTYIKARPELSYIPDNGWTDILKVLYNLDLNDVQLYQMFFRIVDRYIPKDLSFKSRADPPIKKTSNLRPDEHPSSIAIEEHSLTRTNSKDNFDSKLNDKDSNPKAGPVIQEIKRNLTTREAELNNQSVQAYHLLRLLIQYHDPELCSILDSRKVTPNLYVKDWFCSLFARSCSPQLALTIWDTHFKMSDPFLIFFDAIVMVANASDELKKNGLSQHDMLEILKAMPSRLEEDDIEDMYYLVSNHYTSSTPRSIRSYSHLFFMDTFGSTYLGNDNNSDDNNQCSMMDPRTCQLTSNLDLSQYLCLPIVPAEVFALDTAELRSSPPQSSNTLRYFLVDCRPAEQYNAGHLQRAFHLDCSLMLREPSSFATAVQALLDIQRQIVESKSQAGGQHLCFIGSGQEEEDQYVNMVVASFLQKYQKYVSIVIGGFDAIHDYVLNKSELRDLFNNYIVDHNEELCKTCCSKIPGKLEKLKLAGYNHSDRNRLPQTHMEGPSSAQSLFASTTHFLRGDRSVGGLAKLASNSQTSAAASLIAQSGASMLDKFTTAFVSRSSVIKDRLVETLNATTISASQTGGRDHVSSQDKLSKRYTGSGTRFATDENGMNFDDPATRLAETTTGLSKVGEPIQEIQIDSWREQNNIIAFHKCSQVKGNAKHPGYIALSKTHLWILREIPHNKGFASIATKRPLDMIVQITSKRRQPDLIIFRYGNTHLEEQSTTPEPKSLPTIVGSDQLQIPQAFEVIRLIKREIVRIMDESSSTKRMAELNTQ